MGKRARGGRAGVVADCGVFTWDHLDDCHCSAELRGSFQETAPRKTAKNTVKHHDGVVGFNGLVVANHCDGGVNSVVVTTLITTKMH